MITIILLSHNKPVLLKEAVQSVLGQTHQDWQCILFDSGDLFNTKGYFDFITDPRIEIHPSSELENDRETKNMPGWAFNEVLSSGWVKGDLVVYLCDDDILYRDALTRFDWAYNTKGKPDLMVMSEDVGAVLLDGTTKKIGYRGVSGIYGEAYRGKKLDCKVDYLQFCHSLKILNKLGTFRPHSENPKDRLHADGIFMEKLAKLCPVIPVAGIVGMNRRTKQSRNLIFVHTKFGFYWQEFRGRVIGFFNRFKKVQWPS